MRVLSGRILALRAPYLPIAVEETSILISAECQKEVVGEWEGEMESRMGEVCSLDKVARGSGGRISGSVAPNALERGTSSLPNYLKAVLPG